MYWYSKEKLELDRFLRTKGLNTIHLQQVPTQPPPLRFDIFSRLFNIVFTSNSLCLVTLSSTASFALKILSQSDEPFPKLMFNKRAVRDLIIQFCVSNSICKPYSLLGKLFTRKLYHQLNKFRFTQIVFAQIQLITTFIVHACNLFSLKFSRASTWS